MASQSRTTYIILAGVLLVAIILGAALFLRPGGGAGETTTPVTPGETGAETTKTTTSPSTATEEETVVETETKTETKTEMEPVVLRVLTRHPGEIQLAAKEEFLKSDLAKRYNIVDIKFYSVPPVSWISAIESRGDIDVAWGGGPTLFDQLYQAGYLAPLTSDTALEAAAQIPDLFAGAPMKRTDSEGRIYWVAASVASFGFTVNHDVLNQYNLPVPKRWADLASPVYAEPLVLEGREVIAIADPTRSTSNTRMYEIILQAYGWEEGWRVLTGMAANALVEGGSAEVRDDVIQGRVAIGITIDFYGYTAMKANPATEYIIPEGETIINGDPIALLTTSKHPEAAQAFIAWVLTEGQKIWFREDINRLPSNPKAFELPEGRERQDLKAVYDKLSTAKSMEFSDEEALKIESAMQLYFKATLVDLNGILKEVWTTMVQLLMEGRIDEQTFNDYMSMLGAPLKYVDPATGEEKVFTEEDAARVTSVLRENPRLKDAYISAWREAAIAKYESLLDELLSLGG
ncbi:ABC transporter, substrate binding protein [Aeropyrum pernix K1]|uniref:ABC transporter, substrate binding protein n=1 Tax=Aeropyrum pernix (strain ATCC 700893 / DSM 11879 / JCM 9820 / NBRC 100138 / K1) TaxID=272557 RepID=Q9YB69_AERPE|nr:ABC transporter substrate-binding protein [Aeropyrum pernix]BAA80729.1 ABC transporter, substrate binding protein [Aeropyrum pernix K1]